MFSAICAWINGWVNNRDAGDLRRYRAYYDVIVIPKARYGSAFCDLGECLQLEFRFNTYWHQIYSYLEWQGVVPS